jgi:hypothetical protein
MARFLALRTLAMAWVIVASAGAAHGQDAAAAPPPWWSKLEARGWTFLLESYDRSARGYYRLPSQSPAGALPRLWTRWEYSDPNTAPHRGFPSLSQLVEFDCAQGRERVLQTNTFSDHNLDGAMGMSTYDPGPWTYPAPRTANDVMQKIACAARVTPSR